MSMTCSIRAARVQMVVHMPLLRPTYKSLCQGTWAVSMPPKVGIRRAIWLCQRSYVTYIIPHVAHVSNRRMAGHPHRGSQGRTWAWLPLTHRFWLLCTHKNVGFIALTTISIVSTGELGKCGNAARLEICQFVGCIAGGDLL